MYHTEDEALNKNLNNNNSNLKLRLATAVDQFVVRIVVELVVNS